MQRKNSILKKKKNGFAMIMAIAVIVIIATIMALSLSLTSLTTKRTTDIYLYEQASLYAKAAAERALLKIAQNDANANPCGFTGDNYQLDNIYDVNVTARYVYTNFPAGCNVAQQFTTVTTPEQNGSVLLDIAVSINNTTITPEPIRYFRRTIQKL